MPAHTHADTIPVRLAAERLHRLDTLDAWGRLRFDRASGPRLHRGVRHVSARRELVLNVAAARNVARA
jgi:hypothetical protein